MAKYSTRDIVLTISSTSKTKSFKDLHIKCEVIKTISATPSIANITIYNLAPDSLAFLTSIYTSDGFTEFKGAITLDDKEIFNGDLVNVRSTYDMGTWETTIYLNEGYNVFRKTAKIESKKGDTRESIVNQLVDTLKQAGLNDFDIQALKNKCGNKSILKRVLYNGNVIENIKKLIEDCLPKSDIYVDDNKLNVIPAGTSRETTTNLSFFLEPPQLNEVGCRAVTLLNFEPKLSTLITLEAKSYNQAFGNLSTYRANKSRFLGEGTYKVTEIHHEFDNFTKNVAKTSFTGVYLRWILMD